MTDKVKSFLMNSSEAKEAIELARLLCKSANPKPYVSINCRRGYKKNNDSAKSTPKSHHLDGLAADIRPSNVEVCLLIVVCLKIIKDSQNEHLEKIK